MKKIISLCLAFLLGISQLTPLYANDEEEVPQFNNSYFSIDGEVGIPKPVKSPLSFTKNSTLPERYDSRDYGFITDVENQNAFGICWAYAMSASVAANLVKKGISSVKDTNFSEFQLAYGLYHRQNDPLNLTSNDTCASPTTEPFDYLNKGGNVLLATLYYSQWDAPILESEFVNPNTFDKVKENYDAEMQATDPKYIMKDAIFLSANDQEGIKRAVMEYGAVASGYGSGPDVKNDDDKDNDNYLEYYAKYIFNDMNVINHAITIVGYDDTISKDLFAPYKPSQDGAWIIKNSWGTAAGDGGYQYLSYDTMLDSYSIAFNMIEADTYDHNYYYDGGVALFTIESQETDDKIKKDYTRCVNVFHSQKSSTKNQEFLEAVSFVSMNTNTNYSINIYTDIVDPSDPLSGTKVFEKPITGSVTHEGSYTVDLPEAIPLTQGQSFAVDVTLTGNVEGIYPSMGASGSFTYADNLKVVDEAQPYQSFQIVEDSAGGLHSVDLYNNGTTARIHAFTSNKGMSAASKELSALIDECTQYEASHNISTLTSYSAFSSALEVANMAFDNEESEEKDIIEAKNNLNTAYISIKEEFEQNIVDQEALSIAKTNLKQKLDDVKKIIDQQSDTYTPSSIANLNAQYQVATTIYSNATKASDVNDAIKALDVATSQLVEKGDKADLNTLYNSAIQLEQDAYTTSSWNILKSALDKALIVKDDENASQSEVDQAAQAIREATKALVLKSDVKPAIVQNVIANENTYSSIKLSWDKVEGATGYEISSSSKEDRDYSIKKIVGDVNTVIINKLKTGKTYYFKIRAIKGDVKGDDCSAVSQIPTMNVAPVLASVTQKTYGTLQVTWKGVAGAQNYYLERRVAGTSTWKHLKTFKSADRSAESRSLNTGTKYEYRVRAGRYSGEVKSPYSNIKGNTPMMKTTTVSVTKKSSTSAKVSWKTVSGANGYEIYRATSSNGKYTKIKTLKADQKSMTNSKLVKGKTYYYKVRAYRMINDKKVYNNFSKVVSIKM